MIDEDKRESLGCALLSMITVAMILSAVAIGMFFGARWGVALLAAFAFAMFIGTRRNIRKQIKEDGK